MSVARPWLGLPDQHHHFYFGDEAGSPGTIMTFFPAPDAPKGRAGVGELGETAYRIPQSAISYWMARLTGLGVERTSRFGETAVVFQDPACRDRV